MRASITGIAITADVASDPRVAAPFSTPAGESGQVDLMVQTQAGAPLDLTGGQALMSVRLAGALVLSRQADIAAGTGGTCSFPLVVADTVGLAPGGVTKVYTWDVWVTTADRSRYQVVPSSTFTVTAAQGLPNQPVTVPASQLPLAIGPPGTPPVYSKSTSDGTTAVALCTYTMQPSAYLVVRLTLVGRVISPAPADSGLGEVSLLAYFVTDALGNVTQVGQDVQSAGAALSATFGALSPAPVVATSVSGSNVTVTVTGTPNTLINWSAVDSLTLPPPPGGGSGAQGVPGPIGPAGPAGYAPTYTKTTTDASAQTFATYTVGSSALLVVRLRVSAVILPNPGDGGVGEFDVVSYFVSDGSGNVTKVSEDIQSAGGAASASFGALSPAPAVTTTVVGNQVLVRVSGSTATTIAWAATDTMTCPAPPGAQGPTGPTGATGAVGPAGVPSDYVVTTSDLTPTTLASYPVAVNGYRMVELRVVAATSAGAMSIAYVNAYATGDGAGNAQLAESDVTIAPKAGNLAGIAVAVTTSGGNVNVVVTGLNATTITWEAVDWSTTPPKSTPSIAVPTAPSYDADLVVRSGAFKWRQRERAEAVFNGSTDAVSVTWPDFQTRAFEVRAGAPKVTDSLGPVAVQVTNITSTGCTVQASDAFTGSVDIDIAEVV